MYARRILRGLGALVLLLVLVVGIPIGLYIVAGSPIPNDLPSWAQIQSTLTHPDTSGTLVLGVLKYIGWIAWATFAVAVISTVPAAARGRAPRLVRGFGWQQRAAASLIGTIIAMGAVGPALAAPTAAITPTAAPTTVTAQVDAQTPIEAPTAPATDATQAPALPETGPTYQVEPGDSLWRIAEKTLGEGARFQEIANLNYGVTQPDGRSLDASNWLETGWRLQLPAGAAVAAPAAAPAGIGTHVVAPGESLYQIAMQELGDGERYPELAAASADTVQPDGTRLSDPSLIRPGWTITIPGQEPAATDVATETTGDPAPAQETLTVPDDTTASPADADEVTVDQEQAVDAGPVDQTIPDISVDTTPAPETITAPEAEPPTSEDYATDADQAPVIDTQYLQLSAGTLAAGIVSLIAFKRLRARRERRPGQRVPTPTGPTAAIETALRASATTDERTVVNQALRALAWHCRETDAPLPDVHAAELDGEDFTIFLNTPAPLPEPWHDVASQQMWTISLTDAATLDDHNTEAPYPALITVGVRSEATMYLNLEQIGCLNLAGPAETASAILAAMAIEFATSLMADDLQVTLVDVMPELPTFADTGRIRHVASLDQVINELRARGDDITNHLAAAGVTNLAEARARGIATDAWTPEILLIAQPLTDELRTELTHLTKAVPGVGIAAVTADEIGDWILQITDHDTATLHPADVTITTQQLDRPTYLHALELLQRQDPVPGPTWAANLPEAEPTFDQLLHDGPIPTNETPNDPNELPTTYTFPALAEAEETPTGLDDIEQPEAVDSHEDRYDVDEPDDTTITRPTTIEPHPPAATETAPAPATNDEPTPLEHDEPTTPIKPTNTITQIRPTPPTPPALPGTCLRILGPVDLTVETGIPMPDSHIRQATELIAFLAFNPNATSDQISAALWPTSPPNPKTRNSAISRARRWIGTNHLPRQERDQPGYTLNNITTDWDTFLNLIGQDATLTPVSTLMKALALVRGPAFQGIAARKYAWADPICQEITASIVDVAHEAARRALDQGDTATVREASRIGRLADPADERPWRDAIRAEVAAGYPDTANRLIEQLRAHVEALDLDLTPATEDLIAEFDQLTARRPA